VTGTPLYMAPEDLRGCHGMEVDIWAAGVMVSPHIKVPKGCRLFVGVCAVPEWCVPRHEGGHLSSRSHGESAIGWAYGVQLVGAGGQRG
jgi:serine/threonine protein kinase